MWRSEFAKAKTYLADFKWARHDPTLTIEGTVVRCRPKPKSWVPTIHQQKAVVGKRLSVGIHYW